MKRLKLFSIILIVSSLLLLLIGCQDESSIISPDKTAISNEEPNWISLPVPSDNRLMKVHKVTKLITVKDGGKITLKKRFDAGDNTKVEIKAEIKFGPNIVTEDTKFTMALDDKKGMLTFTPAMTFNGSVPLMVSLKGIDLEGVMEDEINFVYFDSNGQLVEVFYKKLLVDVESGILAVFHVEIPHFSRYGFTK